jgi:hypothetical protein
MTLGPPRLLASGAQPSMFPSPKIAHLSSSVNPVSRQLLATLCALALNDHPVSILVFSPLSSPVHAIILIANSTFSFISFVFARYRLITFYRLARENQASRLVGQRRNKLRKRAEIFAFANKHHRQLQLPPRSIAL